MKVKQYKYQLFVLILFSILFFCSCAYADNLLENSDFHLLDADGMPEGWYTDAYVLDPGYTIFSVREGNGEHSRFVEINNIGGNDARFAQFVPVEPDSLYCLSGYVLADDVKGGHGANLSIEGIYAFSEKLYDTHGEWTYIQYYGETGPDQESITVYARLGGYSGESTGKARFSQLCLEKVDAVPGDLIADMWFTATEPETISENQDENEEHSSPAWPALLLTGILFTMIAVSIIYRKTFDGISPLDSVAASAGKKGVIFLILFLALVLRIILCAYVEGYLVDVNCFLSWGRTMADFGPSRFYLETSFCDYPPLYTYMLGFNSMIAQWFGAGIQGTRIVFRIIPTLCDLLAALILYHVMNSQKSSEADPSDLLMLIFLAFNPASVLNSSAWGQMDSVLCLLILLVAIFAVRRKWLIALPVYVISVLVKPQALMLGPLGLAFIIISWIDDRKNRKRILVGIGFCLLVLAAGIIPFSFGQSSDWIISLYTRTLSSYPYATVNTANFYYLLGGNWSGIQKTAPVYVPLLLSFICLCYVFSRKRKTGILPFGQIETILGILTSVWFIVCGLIQADWGLVGTSAMVFSFMIVLSMAVRYRNIRLLPYLGGLLFVLLYVFGVKMHERYLFPALLLFACAYGFIKDRRILYLLCLYTFTLFLNEGIVLDNSIRLGSELGHLNKDTVWLADIISVLNILGALYAVHVGICICSGNILSEGQRPGPYFPVRTTDSVAASDHHQRFDRCLHWTYKDTVILSLITVAYASVSLLTLGSAKAPQTCWTSSSADEQVVFDLGNEYDAFSILYFAQVSRNDFSFSVSKDNTIWSEENWAQMDQGQCWKWKYVTESYPDGTGGRTYYNSDLNNVMVLSGRYIRLSAVSLGLTLNEIVFRDENGNTIPAKIILRTGGEPESELFSDPAALLDEQDTLEKLPVFPGTYPDNSYPAQPSWWNSTYFDEIYHARTAYEFLKGTVPYETSHPPLGKVMMSLSIAIFGMTPFGWRFAGALAGILMLPGMYLLGKQLLKKSSAAILACMLMALDCLHLTQSQIATIDSFPVLFIIFAYLFMLRFLQTDFVMEKSKSSLISLGACGFFMGLSIASKWIGIYAGAGLAVLFFWHCGRIYFLHADKKPLAIRRIAGICLWCLLFFVVIPLIIYLLSYIPYFAYNQKIHSLSDYISEVWRAQTGMFNYHSTKNLGMDHPFYSPWWEWPIIRKPMYYASEQYLPRDGNIHYSIFCFGNPVIWYCGLMSLAVCLLCRIISRRYRIKNQSRIWHLHPDTPDANNFFIAISLLAQYLPWVLVPRGTYIYHYFASLPFLMLSECMVLYSFRTARGQKASSIIRLVLIILAVISFVIFFPYASGIGCPSGWLDIGRSILAIWY